MGASIGCGEGTPVGVGSAGPSVVTAAASTLQYGTTGTHNPSCDTNAEVSICGAPSIVLGISRSGNRCAPLRREKPELLCEICAGRYLGSTAAHRKSSWREPGAGMSR